VLHEVVSTAEVSLPPCEICLDDYDEQITEGVLYIWHNEVRNTLKSSDNRCPIGFQSECLSRRTKRCLFY